MLCSLCLSLFFLYVLRKLDFVESFVVFGEGDTMESKFEKVLLLRAFINSMNNIFWLLHAFIFLQFLCFSSFTLAFAVSNYFCNNTLNISISWFKSKPPGFWGRDVGAVATVRCITKYKKTNDIEFMSSVGFLCGYLNRNKSKYQNKNVSVLENFLHWSRFLHILEQMIRKRLLNC